MKSNVKKAIDDFVEVPQDEEDFDKMVKEQKKKFIKSDFAIIERIERDVIVEDGRMLLREVY